MGEETAARYEVLNHDARIAAQHRRLGITQSGTPVWIDERFMSADLHLTLGFIEPHLMLGFSGGRKLVAPGLAAEARSRSCIVRASFATRARMRAISRAIRCMRSCWRSRDMARQDFILDVALNKDRGISAVFTGEPEEAHRHGMAGLHLDAAARGRAF